MNPTETFKKIQGPTGSSKKQKKEKKTLSFSETSKYLGPSGVIQNVPTKKEAANIRKPRKKSRKTMQNKAILSSGSIVSRRFKTAKVEEVDLDVQQQTAKYSNRMEVRVTEGQKNQSTAGASGSGGIKTKPAGEALDEKKMRELNKRLSELAQIPTAVSCFIGRVKGFLGVTYNKETNDLTIIE